VPFFQTHIFAPVFGLLTNVIVQLTRARYAKGQGLLCSVFEGFLSGYATVIAIEGAHFLSTKPNWMEIAGEITLSTITYLALGYGYFHFVNLGETARRVRIMRELWESENGLSINELLERYSASEILNMRLQRMINNRQIVLRNGRYYIGRPVMLYMAKTIVMMKLVLLKKRSKFE